MKFKPEQWTHHHTHRLFHISLGICFAYIVGMLSAGLVVAWFQIQASNDVAITANIGEVEPGPTQIIPPSGVAFVPPPQLPKSVKPDVSVEPVAQEPEQKIVEVPGGTTLKMFEFNRHRPLFKGATNIPNALIFLEIHSDVVLYGTTQADEKGNWQWLSPEDLDAGVHKLLVTARDPNDAKIFVTTSLDFYINPQIPSEQAKPIVPVSNVFLKNLFGIFLTIPNEYKRVSAGEEVIANLRLYSEDDAGTKDIRYSVIGPDNDTVLESAETLPAGAVLAFKKTFIIHPGARSGLYTIQVVVPHLINTAVASDHFQILPSPAGVAGTTFIITPLIMEIVFALLLLFIFLTFFAYRRVLVLSRVIKYQNITHNV